MKRGVFVILLVVCLFFISSCEIQHSSLKDVTGKAPIGAPSSPLGGSICGNGVIEDGEECDDGNERNGDGCSTRCTEEETLPKPVTTLTCGNGVIEDGEECDDGNWVDCDGCSSECKFELDSIGNCGGHIPLPPILVPVPVYGCTDHTASNYNPAATEDDGSCNYPPDILECLNEPEGTFIDCDGVCFYDRECEDAWGVLCSEGIGDGYCDDGTYGINLVCSEYDLDGGDCEISCEDFGFIEDCDGTCFDPNSFEWEDDGICDTGEEFVYNMICEEFGYDSADCGCFLDSDCEYSIGLGASCKHGLCRYLGCDGSYFFDEDCIGDIYFDQEDIEGMNGAPIVIGSVVLDRNGGKDVSGVQNPGEEEYYDGCIFGDITWFGDDHCQPRFNCEDWGFDGGDCIFEDDDDFGGNVDFVDLAEDIRYIVDTDLLELFLDYEPSALLLAILSEYYDEINETDSDSEVIFEFTESGLQVGSSFRIQTYFFDVRNTDFIVSDGNLIVGEDYSTDDILDGYNLESHVVVIKNIDTTSKNSIVEVFSTNPKEISVGLYSPTKVDLNNDGILDVSIELVHLSRNQISVKTNYFAPQVVLDSLVYSSEGGINNYIDYFLNNWKFVGYPIFALLLVVLFYFSLERLRNCFIK